MNMAGTSNGTPVEKPSLPPPDSVKPISQDVFIIEKKGLEAPQPAERR